MASPMISFRASPVLADAIRSQAGSAGLSISEYLRGIMGAATADTPPPIGFERVADAASPEYEQPLPIHSRAALPCCQRA